MVPASFVLTLSDGQTGGVLLTMSVQEIVDDLDKLLAVLPPHIRTALEQQPELSELLEVVLDLGRKPEARFPKRFVYLSDQTVTREDLDFVVERVGEFNRDNRAGIEGTLHRISCIRNRSGRIVGLTCRVGRAVFGTVNIIRDIVESGKNILLLGKPGVGKCVTGDSFVWTSEGLLPLQVLIPSDIKPGDFRPTALPLAGLRGWAQATEIYFDGVRSTICITTQLGFSLEGTPNHLVLTLSPSGRLTWRPLGELQRGDVVAIARGHFCFGTEEAISPNDAQFLGIAVAERNELVPTDILVSSATVVKAFLQGFFDRGATLSPQGIITRSPSPELLRQIQMLLLGFGIVAQRRLVSSGSALCAVLSLKGEAACQFVQTIGFRSESKQHQALRYLQQWATNPFDLVPYVSPWLRKLSIAGGNRVLSTCSQGTISYAELEALLGETEQLSYLPEWQFLRQLTDMQFFYDRVAKIEQRQAPVYDFVVADIHAFVANGLVCHNTTKLREIARILADEFGKRVIVVDTSNEIAGDGDVPHPGIGTARRMQVPSPEKQADVMIEAVENHMPEVIIVDEIGRKEEADAARTIAERGVQLIATAHGNTLDNLVANPLLCDLVGGIQAVTLSDEEARRRGTQKTVLERKAPPTFDVVVELVDRHKVAIHHDTAEAVDALLRGKPIQPEVREELPDGSYRVVQPKGQPERDEQEGFHLSRERGGRVYAFGVSRKHLERAVLTLNIPLRLVSHPSEADFVLTLETHLRKHSHLRSLAQSGDKPVFAIRSNSYAQVERLLRLVFGISRTPEEERAVREAEAAVQLVLQEKRPVELPPAAPHLRKLQHQVAERYRLPSESIGREPRRRVVIYPNSD